MSNLIRLKDVCSEMPFTPVLVASYEIASYDFTPSYGLLPPLILPTDIHAFQPLVRPLSFPL